MLTRRKLVQVTAAGIIGGGWTHGNSSGADIWTALDGRANAPTGTPQLPTLLNGYAPGTGRVRTGNTIAASVGAGNYQPPWMVAGVDYRVGINTGVTLKNPRTDTLPANVTRDTTARIFSVNAANVTLDSWDFTEGGGWVIDAGFTGTNCTITNNRFAYNTVNTTNMSVDLRGVTGTIFRYNEIDGSNLQTDNHFLTYENNIIIEYNYFLNMWNDVQQLHTGGTGGQLYFQFNLINEIAVGTDGNHGDIYNTVCGASTDWNDLVNSFNTSVQHVNKNQSNGYYFTGNDGTITNPTISNNTAVCYASGVCYPPGTCSPPFNDAGFPYSFVFRLEDNAPFTFSGTINVLQNYIDPSACSDWIRDPTAAAKNISQNINMTNGATLT